MTLYIPIVDLSREGGRVTENGAVICDRPVPFHMVNEVWLCIPGSAYEGQFEDVEKILDYGLEDEICTEVAMPLTPAAKDMRGHRSLERILELLCDLPSSPHDGTKIAIINQLSEYFGVDWTTTMRLTPTQSSLSFYIQLHLSKQEQAEIETSDSDCVHGA